MIVFNQPVMSDAGTMLPRCPVPGHESSRVVLGGKYGRPGRQRQLYVCDMPKPGSNSRTHRFTDALSRPVATLVTSAAADPAGADVPEELRGARSYQFSAQDIATALVEVGRGASYAEAGLHARERAARRWGTDPAGRRHGTLVSDWVEVYAQALWDAQAAFATRWPDTVFLTARALTSGPSLVFSVLVAAAYTPRGELRIIGIRTANGTGCEPWTEFLRDLKDRRLGAPVRMVGDGSRALSRAVAATWPDDPPALWVDEHHLREQGRRILQRVGLNHRREPLWRAALTAWRSAGDWDRFVAEAARYRVPELDRWLATVSTTMAEQFAARESVRRRSVVGLTRRVDDLARRLGPRATTFANRERTNRLLLLMALDLSGQARVNTWTAHICDWLQHGNGRPATRQRTIADATGRYALRGNRV